MARKTKKRKQGIEIEHFLKPKHEKLSEKEKKELKGHYRIGVNQLPGISITDPAIASLDPKVGDIIKITRKSQTGGKSFFYREVIYESALDMQ